MNRRVPLAICAIAAIGLVAGLAISGAIPLPNVANPSIPGGYVPPPPGPNWTQLATGLTPTTNASMMTFDPSVSGLLLVAADPGCGGSSTWTFASGAWTNLTAQVGPGPAPGRGGGGLAYDAADNEAILFGGLSACGAENDTWAFANDTWSLVATATAPPPLYDFAMTYDDSDGYVLLTGGCCIAGADSHETWAFHAGAWTNLTQSPTPVVDADSAMTYDGALGQVVFVGGYASGYVSQATWTFHDGLWQRLYPVNSPSNRAGLGLAYDAAIQKDILVGGYTKVTKGVYANLTDTWTYGSGHWENITGGLTTTPPFVKSPTLVAYDPARLEVVLFAGPGQTWVLK